MATLDGVAFVLGAGSGIGLECALTFAERGASALVLADLNLEAVQVTAERSKKLATHPQYRCVSVRVDVTDRASVEAAAKEAMEKMGRVDYFVSTAGITSPGPKPIIEASIEDFERIMSINATGVLTCIQVFGRLMSAQEGKFVEGRNGRRSLGRGSMVVLVSLSSQLGSANWTAYGASKHAAMGIVRSAALGLVKEGVRVNAVNPSWVDTPLVRAIGSKDENWEKQFKALPAGRFAKPEEVTGAVHFLSGPDASYINGIGLTIDSGMTCALP